MPVTGFVKFEQFFRAAAKANTRDIIEPWDPPITRGIAGEHPRVRAPRRRDRAPAVLEDLAARPPLDVALSEETENRLPLIFGGVSTALARTFKLADAELKAVYTRE